MRRIGALRGLSREHNDGLLLARTARRAATGGSPPEVRRCWERLSDAWHTELAAHFATEERLIVPLLERVGESWLARRLLREHRAIRRGIEDPSRWNRARLAAIADVLASHIRREERYAFPVVERHADDDTLGLLAGHGPGADGEIPTTGR